MSRNYFKSYCTVRALELESDAAGRQKRRSTLLPLVRPVVSQAVPTRESKQGGVRPLVRRVSLGSDPPLVLTHTLS